jgi:hypothetical protein
MQQNVHHESVSILADLDDWVSEALSCSVLVIVKTISTAMHTMAIIYSQQ